MIVCLFDSFFIGDIALEFGQLQNLQSTLVSRWAFKISFQLVLGQVVVV